jgi:hypothetical protein
MSESSAEEFHDNRHERESKKLLELATPDIYWQNAFRVLGLPVEASPHEINRQRSRLQMMRKVGIRSAGPLTGMMPLNPPPDEDQIARATQRLNDPESRLLDELFWFWPHNGNSSADEALRLLASNCPDNAQSLWMQEEQGSSQGKVSTHNLAVFYHIIALDLERASANALNAEHQDTRNRAWEAAFKRWQILMDDEGFWSRLTARIRELDDPRLTTGTARRIRYSLPKALLLINARLALRAAERNDESEVKRHLALMQYAGSSPSIRQEALQDVVSSIRQRIHFACEAVAARASSDAAQADKYAAGLLEETEPLLRTIDWLLPKGNSSRGAAFDDVVGCALRCQILFGNESENWLLSIRILESILPLAGSETVRARVQENLKIVKRNSEEKRIFGNLKPINNAPSLGRVFSVGFRLYGHKDFDIETQSYLTTYYFVVLGIPIFPIRRYRVIRESNRYRFLGSATLRVLDKWHLGISLSVIIFAIILWVLIALGSPSNNSTSYGAAQQANETSPATASSSVNRPSAQTANDGQQTLLAQIQSAKARTHAMELELNQINSQLEALSSQIENYKQSIKSYESQADLGQEIDRDAYAQAISSHNALVEQHNTILGDYREKYAVYKTEIDHVNKMVGQYNAGSK